MSDQIEQESMTSEEIGNEPADRSVGVLADLRFGFKRMDGARLRSFLGWLVVVMVVFSGKLISLFRFAWENSLYSHILIIPVVALYLFSLRIRDIRVGARGDWWPGIGLLAVGVALWFFGHQTSRQPDSLACSTLAFLALIAAGAFAFLGAAFVRGIAFPLGFLVFMAPFPEQVEHGIVVFFQRGSAEAAAVLLKLANVPVLRDGMFFRIPGIVLEVAEECSGIRSSLVLFVTSVFAGAILLRKPWSRTVLAFAVIPLGILRNGFRILTISLLCVHVDPSMVDSPIHHRGGPLFFALSLVPFLGLLVLLRKLEKPKTLERLKNDAN